MICYYDLLLIMLRDYDLLLSWLYLYSTDHDTPELGCHGSKNSYPLGHQDHR